MLATVNAVADDGGLAFAEKVLSLVETGRKSATYKLATLLALMGLPQPDEMTGKSLIRKA